MKEIKLEDIVGYLPHGLKCEILNYKSDYVGMKYGVVAGYYFFDGEPHYMFKNKGCAGKSCSLIKPIVRPLSDLTKEIEHDGEKFIPIFKLTKLCDVENDSNWIEHVYDFMTNDADWTNAPYWMVIKLYEWHFDIHNWIGDGLAISNETQSY